MPSKSSRPSIAILASGDGSNFEAIVQATRSGALHASVVGLVCNRASAKVLERAARLNVPQVSLVAKSFFTAEEWNKAIAEQLARWQSEWVVLAGFTGLIGKSLLQSFPERIVNSHPSLLPRFGGKGMYGLKVHQAVIAAGEHQTGISVHLVNERFDEGPILAQKSVPVLAGDAPEALAERLKAVEQKFYPEVLQDLLTGRIKAR